MLRPGVDEDLQAHQPDDLGRAVHVLVVRRGVVARGREVGAHRREERADEVVVDAALPRRAREGVHDEIRAEAALDRRERLGLEVVEHRAGLVGREPGRGGRAVDDLVGHPHQRVDVAHVRARPRAEQPAGQGERGRVRGDDGGCGILAVRS